MKTSRLTALLHRRPSWLVRRHGQYTCVVVPTATGWSGEVYLGRGAEPMAWAAGSSDHEARYEAERAAAELITGIRTVDVTGRRRA